MSVIAWSESYFPIANLRDCISAIIELSDKTNSTIWHHLRLPDSSVISIPNFDGLASTPSKYELSVRQDLSFDTSLNCENDEMIAAILELQLSPEGPAMIEVGVFGVRLTADTEFAMCSITAATSSLAGLFSGSRNFHEMICSIHDASSGIFGRVTCDVDEGHGQDLESLFDGKVGTVELEYGEVFEGKSIDEIVRSYQRWETSRA